MWKKPVLTAAMACALLSGTALGARDRSTPMPTAEAGALRRVQAVFDDCVRTGKMSGVVAAIGHGTAPPSFVYAGKVSDDPGAQDAGPDSLWRIYSMTVLQSRRGGRATRAPISRWPRPNAIGPKDSAGDDKMRLFCLGSDRGLAGAAAIAAGVEIDPVEEREFADGEHKSRPLVSVRNEDVYVIARLHGHAGKVPGDLLMRLLFFVATCKENGAARVTAVPPTCPSCARSGRPRRAIRSPADMSRLCSRRPGQRW